MAAIRIEIQKEKGRTRLWGSAAEDADDLIVSPSVDLHVSAEPQVVATAVEWAAKELRGLIDG